MSVVPDVQDAAASVLTRIRAAETAHRRHLEDIEAEAARRCERLTAQAELDAELIRLEAHRSARAIVSAARARAGALRAGEGTADRPRCDVAAY